jgi:hypothetical protein
LKVRTAGTDWNTIPLPFFAPEGEGDGGGDGTGGDPNGNGDGDKSGEGSFAFDAGKAYADLDADTRNWLQSANVLEDPKALATKAYNQEKLLGGSIRIPGKDAPKEEVDAFLNKLGRPEKADGYKLEVPKDMPEGLPYDGEFAKRASRDTRPSSRLSLKSVRTRPSSSWKRNGDRSTDPKPRPTSKSPTACLRKPRAGTTSSPR